MGRTRHINEFLSLVLLSVFSICAAKDLNPAESESTLEMLKSYNEEEMPSFLSSSDSVSRPLARTFDAQGRPVYYVPGQAQYALNKNQEHLSTMRARVSHARNRMQQLEGEGSAGETHLLEISGYFFIAFGGTLLVCIRVGIPVSLNK
uniref:Uncharacterized protein n=1 Tax=Guillardia theta TaxID=55529 RepID=A0A7S4UU77_GUITH|mmetsp:Transcript_8464/g.28386  ORF Transcript_8464/g.28386 Transcript_8464/m.28386 type:complete len:148 (+) Transcript_8464:159-602(+)